MHPAGLWPGHIGPASRPHAGDVPQPHERQPGRWAQGYGALEEEVTCEDEGAQCDDEGAVEEDADTGDYEPDFEGEPSLGSLGGTATSHGSQISWAGGDDLDNEEEHDGREPDGEGDDADHEPSLAAPEGAQFYVNAPRFLEEVDAELNEVAA